MVYPPLLLDRLQAAAANPWQGRAFRHMFADYPPDAENTRGARWNPAEVAAIYTSLTRDGVIAEAEHRRKRSSSMPSTPSGFSMRSTTQSASSPGCAA